MSVLNVAEKPSVASGATKLLTRDWSNAHSLSRYNPCYQFDYEGRTHYFTSVSGHVFEHKF
jgi:DNA topoisomerase III